MIASVFHIYKKKILYPEILQYMTLGPYMLIYTKDEVCMTIYSELSIHSKHKKSTKMSVINSFKSE